MSEAKPPAKRPRGRPKGSKNKKTLAREKDEERVRELANQRISNKIVGIVEKLCDKALAGDTTAAKLILDRFIPTVRSKDERSESPMSININITAAEVETHGITIDQENGETDHAAESGTGRQELAGPSSPTVVSIDGSAEGEW